MSRLFDITIDNLAKETGYSYDFLVDRYNEVMENGKDWEYFLSITLKRGW